MSTQQWLRQFRLTVKGSGGTLIVTDLRIDFNLAKSIGSKQNKAEITVYNLTASHRNQLGDEFDTITLEVGYRDTGYTLLFSGNIRDVKSSQDGASVKSVITCGDGDKAIGKGAVSKTFPAGTKPKEIIDHIVGEMPEVKRGQIKGLDNLPAYKRPVSIFGWAQRALDTLGREHGFYWTIHNGSFEAMKNDEHLDETIMLSKASGLIGSPDITDKGIKAKALLNPSIAPGRRVDVQSDFLDQGRQYGSTDKGGGLFRVADCTYKGSNRDNDYFVEFSANRIQGNKVVK